MNLVDPAHLSLHDDLNIRIQRSIQHLIELNNDEMRKEFTSPTDFWHWGADYMGRWIAALGLLGHYTHQEYGVRAVVQELIDFQNPDGSFGTFSDPHDFQEWFGMGRGLIGLLEYHNVNPDPGVLESAARLGHYYINAYPYQAECMAECYSNGLEGLVRLARLTQDVQFLSIARQIANNSVVHQGVYYSADVAANGRRTPCAGQVHCQLATARGLLDLYELTGEEIYLQSVIRLQSYIVSELLWITGGIGFYYFRPEENETCADADWFRLNLQLWRITNETRYMDLAEKIMLNQLYFDQVDNGAFCYLRGLQNRAGAVFDACCSHHGPRALYDALCYSYSVDGTQISVNLFTTGDVQVPLDGGSVSIKTDLKATTQAWQFSLEISQAQLDAFTIKYRIPEWSDGAACSLNGQPVLPSIQDGYAAITRIWKAGDQLEITLPQRVSIQCGETLGQHILDSNLVAVSFGPKVFCLNDLWNTNLRVHLAKVKVSSNPGADFEVLSANQIRARGVTPECADETLLFTPLAEVGGVPSGMGRIHTVRSPYYKVWLPYQE